MHLDIPWGDLTVARYTAIGSAPATDVSFGTLNAIAPWCKIDARWAKSRVGKLAASATAELCDGAIDGRISEATLHLADRQTLDRLVGTMCCHLPGNKLVTKDQPPMNKELVMEDEPAMNDEPVQLNEQSADAPVASP
jgi:hypothetical protein